MSFHRRLILSIIFALFTLPGFAVAQQVNPTLTGEWTTNCLPIGKDGRHGYVSRVKIDNNAITATSQIYAKSSCQTPTVQVNFTGSLIQIRDEDEQIHIEHVVHILTMTPNIKDVVDHYNKQTDDQAGCGLSGWQENIPMSVTGKTCGLFSFSPEGTHLFDSAWIEKNQLRFGAFPVVWTNTSPEKAPLQPIETIYYRTGR